MSGLLCSNKVICKNTNTTSSFSSLLPQNLKKQFGLEDHFSLQAKKFHLYLAFKIYLQGLKPFCPVPAHISLLFYYPHPQKSDQCT